MVNAKIKHNCKIELNDLNLRATPARIAVMQLLENTHTPIDITIIKKHLDKEKIATDSATVFRIMNMFTDKGITKQVSFNEGKFRYELASREDHHHLICQNCGRVEDFSDCEISALEKDINKKKKFLVRNHSLEFFGLCFNCQKKEFPLL